MNTSPGPRSNADVVRMLNEIIDYHLYESDSWPADEEAISAYWRTLKQAGLTEMVPGHEGSFRFTVQGKYSGAPIASALIGAFELTEIPDQLGVQELIEAGEIDEFYETLEDGDDHNILKHVEMMVRRAHKRLCGMNEGALH